jgi:hypothetical protein
LKTIKKRANSSSRAARASPRTQNESSRKRGGQAGNENAKKSLKWLDRYDLSSPEGVESFLHEVIQRTWTGELGTRAAGALNGSLRILLEHLTLPSLEARIKVLEEAREVKTN